MAVGITAAVASRAAVRQRYFSTIDGNVQFQALRCNALNAIPMAKIIIVDFSFLGQNRKMTLFRFP